MTRLTSLEEDVVRAILHTLISDPEKVNLVVGDLRVSDRIFSGVTDGCCSGFYTHFHSNSVLSDVGEVLRDYSVQGRCTRLSAGEMGFLMFCDQLSKSFEVLEGYFYGEDRLPIDELLQHRHNFLVYTLPGL